MKISIDLEPEIVKAIQKRAEENGHPRKVEIETAIILAFSTETNKEKK